LHFGESRIVTALTIVSLVFLIFTVAIGVEKIEAIETGKGKIARMKQSVGQRRMGQESRSLDERPTTGRPWYPSTTWRVVRGLHTTATAVPWSSDCSQRRRNHPRRRSSRCVTSSYRVKEGSAKKLGAAIDCVHDLPKSGHVILGDRLAKQSHNDPALKHDIHDIILGCIGYIVAHIKGAILA
jgi:hypothetical protein